MSEITGTLSYASYRLDGQVPVLTIDGGATESAAGPRVTTAERVNVQSAIIRYRQMLWQRSAATTRAQFAALLEDYVRLVTLPQLGVETTPLIAGEFLA